MSDKGGHIEVAKAYVTIIPSLRGAQGAISKELDPAAASAGESAGKKAGKGAVTLDGGMIDKPMELRARTTLAQAEAAGINVEGMVL